MNKLPAVVAALLLSGQTITNVATAAPIPDNSGSEYLGKDADVPRKQKKKEKILSMMKSLGVYDKDIAHFVDTVDKNIKDNNLMLYQEKISTGKISLRYDFEPDISNKKLGIVYTPNNSKTEYTIHTNSVVINYKLKF